MSYNRLNPWRGAAVTTYFATAPIVQNAIPPACCPTGGYTHIVDFTDPMHPKKVARYQLEDFGFHDIIVQDDVLYQAYYDGSVRLVDVSGEPLGNLADQGRDRSVGQRLDVKNGRSPTRATGHFHVQYGTMIRCSPGP